MKTIAINSYITATLTEKTYEEYMEVVNYLRWRDEAFKALRELEEALETATGQEAVELWGEYSDIHKDLFGYRPR